MTKPIDILRKGVDHWNQWRKENRKIKPDLSNTNLSGEDLSFANLKDVNLSEANLSESLLWGADLSHGNLYKANLSNAKLMMTELIGTNLACSNLSKASLAGSKLWNTELVCATLTEAGRLQTDIFRSDLSGANFTEAYLTNTILSHVKLVDTNFKNSRMENTIFAFTNLSKCKNLESVLVKAPCSIDIETLRNYTDISKEFLFKNGFTDSQIDYLPHFIMNEGIQLYPVFISHASVNKSFCGPFYERLIRKGVKVWYDDRMIKPGDSIRKKLHKGVSLYDKMLLVCSKESLSSWWVRDEIERYEAKEREYWKQHGEEISLIIPIAIDDEAYNSKSAVAIGLKNKRNIADFRNWQDEEEYEKAFEILLAALNVNPGGVDPISYLKQ